MSEHLQLAAKYAQAGNAAAFRKAIQAEMYTRAYAMVHEYRDHVAASMLEDAEVVDSEEDAARVAAKMRGMAADPDTEHEGDPQPDGAMAGNASAEGHVTEEAEIVDSEEKAAAVAAKMRAKASKPNGVPGKGLPAFKQNSDTPGNVQKESKRWWQW